MLEYTNKIKELIGNLKGVSYGNSSCWCYRSRNSRSGSEKYCEG